MADVCVRAQKLQQSKTGPAHAGSMLADGPGLAESESESAAAEHAEQQLHKVSRAGPGFLPSDCTPLSIGYETIPSQL